MLQKKTIFPILEIWREKFICGLYFSSKTNEKNSMQIIFFFKSNNVFFYTDKNESYLSRWALEFVLPSHPTTTIGVVFFLLVVIFGVGKSSSLELHWALLAKNEANPWLTLSLPPQT